jgi:glucose-6-phosphate isomerase
MQLFMEGPRDKLVTFIDVKSPGADLQIPQAEGPFAYLSGTALSQVLAAELRGTALALAEDHRPSLTIVVERLDARALGALFFLYESATAFAGELYGIDAFDQPGVELGKRLASGLLGRPGFEDARDQVAALEGRMPKTYTV